MAPFGAVRNDREIADDVADVFEKFGLPRGHVLRRLGKLGHASRRDVAEAISGRSRAPAESEDQT